ncbi:MAG: hypothetical protein IKM73_05205 [Acidaminococcaceae bacterium]|nr:hypothetical protein [Acidaminococcaceae bacterium]
MFRKSNISPVSPENADTLQAIITIGSQSQGMAEMADIRIKRKMEKKARKQSDELRWAEFRNSVNRSR